MSRYRWLWIVLLGLFVVSSIYAMTNPEIMGQRAQAWRDSELSVSTKDMITALIGLAVAGYLGWFFLVRRN